METEDDDNSNPYTDPTLLTEKPPEPVSDTLQETGVDDVAQSEQPVDSKEVDGGSERVEAVKEGIEKENRNAGVAEEVRVAGEFESTETGGVENEVADVAGGMENKGTEATKEDDDVAEELGDVRNEELVKEANGGAAEESENMAKKDEAVDGVANSEMEGRINLEGVGDGGEELSLGQKEEVTDEVEEREGRARNVGENTKMLDDTEEMEEEKVANSEGLEHPEGVEGTEEAKLNEREESVFNVGEDTKMVDDTEETEEEKVANREGLEHPEGAEHPEEAEGAEEAKLNEREESVCDVGEDTILVEDTEEIEEEVANSEGLEHPEGAEGTEEAKLNEREESVCNMGEDTKMVDDTEEMEEEKVSNGEGFERAEGTEEAKLNENNGETDAAQGSGDGVNEKDEMGAEEMADTEEERENEGEMESVVVGEEKEEAEEGEGMKELEETEMAEVAEEEESSISAGGKRKRGKNAKSPAKPPSKKKAEEDVCFICFDGGNLVLCDRRGCPKAYHPSCVNRDEAFFQTKGRWNCGWHICSNCQKNAHYMCFTCTFSLCKGCIKEAVIFCVRGNKGFCEACMRTVTMIEGSEQGNMEMVNFDDKNSWEYLFKDYWMDLKGKLSLTSEELAQAKNPWKGIDLHPGKQGLSEDLHDADTDGGSGSDSSSGDAEPTASKRRKRSKRLRSRAKGRGSKRKSTLTDGDFEDGSVGWASKELIEFVAHMKNGDKSVCSQFDVQALLLEYIKRNKLRDPRKKSQIICDARLESLFGKPRVGHFEMLKLLESHFFLKEDSQGDDLQGSVVDNETNHLETDGSTSVKMNKDKKGKSRKKGRGLQSNLDDFAAIDLHNINLIYLRRSLVENLLEDTETFHEKVVGSFVRIRISGNAQKQDLYRLVQVVGTSKAAEPYKVGKKMTDCVLEILNLSKTEVVLIDIISNQDFTEDECKRLRQSIKCGLINPLTVGDVQEKALALQAVRVEDSLESEVTRLAHLRDRASDMGKRKELRECVEKLQLLKAPEERQRRLAEIPEIHVDPNMDPNIELEEDEDEADDKKQESFLRPRGSGFSRRGREPVSPRKGSFASNDSWSGTKNISSSNRELSRSVSNKGFSNKEDDAIKADEMLNESLWSHGREKELQVSQSWEKSKTSSNLEPRGTHSLLKSEMPRGTSEMSPTHPSVGAMQSTLKINESDKVWHYRDPSGKIQGPFSMVQLKKWSNTGYFPDNLRIWRITEKEDNSILLADALKGNFQKETPPIANSSLQSRMVDEARASPSLVGRAGESWKSQTEISNSAGEAASATVSVPNSSSSRWGPESSLPSPTPARTPIVATKGQLYESQWSPTPTQPADNGIGANPFSRGSRDLQNRESGHHNTQLHPQSQVPNDSPRGQVNSHLHSAPDSRGGRANVSIDLKSLENLIQPITGNKPVVGAQGWGPTTVSKPEMNPSNSSAWSGSSQKQESEKSVAQPNTYGNWVNVPASVISSASFSTANPTGVSPVPAPSSSVPRVPWSAPVPAQSSVPPPSIPSNMQWGAGVADNKSGTQRQGAENQSTGWVAIPANTNAGWGGPVSANPNHGWAAPGQGMAPGNINMGWGAPSQGQVPGNTNSGWVGPVPVQTPGNAYQNWAPPAQGSGQMNPNPAWGAPSHAQPPANSNASWGAHGSNEKNNMVPGDRFSGHRDRGSQGGDSGYGGNKPWSRQSSFGNRGDSSRPPLRGQRICKFHESGHCKKGAQCDYLHT